MTDAREARYALALLMATWPNGDRIEGVTKRTAELLAPGVVALADTELAALEQECRDRECTEQDVRARLADADAKLAQVKSALLMGGQTAVIRAQAAIAIVWDGTS